MRIDINFTQKFFNLISIQNYLLPNHLKRKKRANLKYLNYKNLIQLHHTTLVLILKKINF